MLEIYKKFMKKKILISALMFSFVFAGGAYAAEVIMDGGAGSDTITCADLGIARTLKKGSRGVQVEILQEVLMQSGYYDAEITAVFDTVTIAAVKSMQSDLGVRADGVVGPKTRTAMGDMCMEYGNNS